jgi:hypothetical protein
VVLAKTLNNRKRMDALQTCLIERFALNREKRHLVAKESDTFDPKGYVACVAKLEIVNSKLHALSLEISRLATELHQAASSTTEISVNGKPSSTMTDALVNDKLSSVITETLVNGEPSSTST